MQRHLGLLFPFLALACVAEAFSFHAPPRSPALRAASLQGHSLAVGQGQRHAATRRMAAPSMMAAGGAKKKVLVLGGDGCVSMCGCACSSHDV